MSTSKKELPIFNSGIKMIIHSKTGKNISALSLYDESSRSRREDEILFMPNSKFKVVSNTEVVNPYSADVQNIIVLKEITQVRSKKILSGTSSLHKFLVKGQEEDKSLWPFSISAYDKASSSCIMMKEKYDIRSNCQIYCKDKNHCSWVAIEWIDDYFESLTYNEIQLEVYEQVE